MALGREDSLVCRVGEGWPRSVVPLVSRLGRCPDNWVPSFCCAMANFIEVRPALERQTYTFSRIDSWMHVGLLLLLATNRGPDCSRGQDAYSGRLPQIDGFRREAPVLVESPAATVWPPSDDFNAYDANPPTQATALRFEAGARASHGIAFLPARNRFPDAQGDTECRHPGTRRWRVPQYNSERSDSRSIV